MHLTTIQPSTAFRGTSIAGVPTHRNAIGVRCRKLAVVATSSPADINPAGTSPTWDPDGILPPPPEGGHFARREREQAGGAAAVLLAPKATTAPVKRPVGEVPGAPEESVGRRIEAMLLETFPGGKGISRVMDSFKRLRSDKVFRKEWPDKGMQDASSYIEGLFADPFPDLHSGHYPWLEAVERQAPIIQEEFAAAMADAAKLAKGNNVWVPAARDDALAYGPEWRTLVIQDRGQWDKVNSKIFPRTQKIFTSLDGKQRPTHLAHGRYNYSL